MMAMMDYDAGAGGLTNMKPAREEGASRGTAKKPSKLDFDGDVIKQIFFIYFSKLQPGFIWDVEKSRRPWVSTD